MTHEPHVLLQHIGRQFVHAPNFVPRSFRDLCAMAVAALEIAPAPVDDAVRENLPHRMALRALRVFPRLQLAVHHHSRALAQIEIVNFRLRAAGDDAEDVGLPAVFFDVGLLEFALHAVIVYLRIP